MSGITFAAAVALLLAEAAVLIRAILRPHREPAARLAWVLIIIAAPVVGMCAYMLVGETRVCRRELGRAIDRRLTRPPADPLAGKIVADSVYSAPFALASTVNRLPPTTANSATLSADSNSSVIEMVADIDSAASAVHLCTYIWLEDHNGLMVKDALVRAARRGITVRALADALGSRRFIRSRHWADLKECGAEMRIALPVGNPLWTVLRGRLDLRNHRKSLVVDGRIAWCGSQNLADPRFRIKPRFAPWVDIMTRWEGPVAHDCDFLFVSDWIAGGGADISDHLRDRPPRRDEDGKIIAQAIGSGPTLEFDAMPSCFSELIHSAREELVVTTPYFLPDEQLLYALTSAARRGVRTILVFPKRNDSRLVAAASRSYYADLISAGASIYEFRPGLLHAKTMVVDRAVAMIGSANLDRRSFELNFENNILFADAEFAAVLRARQETFISQSVAVTEADVEAFGFSSRLWQNTLAMLSPIL